MLVHEFLEKSADWYGNKTALIFENQRLTYRQIETRANRLANALRDRGVGRGERVVLWLPNCVELVVGIFATLKVGAVFVVVNYATRPKKLAYIARNCQARVLVTTMVKVDDAREIREEVASLTTIVVARPPFTGGTRQEGILPADDLVYFDDIDTFSSSRPPHVNIDRDLACLIYTPDSSGVPKGVMSDHSNVVFAASAIIEYLHNVPDDIVVNVLPLSLDYGLYQLLMVFKFGGTLVLERGFSFPRVTLRRMVEERVTGFPGVPTMFAMLLQMDLSSYKFNLRYLINSMVAPSTTNLDRLREVFPGATLYSTYGVAEINQALYVPLEELDTQPQSAGIAIPGTEVWIEDEEGNRLGPGQTGELVVRGRHVMRGYWGDEEVTRQRFRPGSLPGERLCYTGDLFSMDKEGFFYFVAHRSEIIECRGNQVAPKEVENVLYALAGVQEAAVKGVPDPIQGQVIKAFVVTDGRQMTKAQVLAHCRKNLEDFMLPKHVVMCQELPKAMASKINKRGLQ